MFLKTAQEVFLKLLLLSTFKEINIPLLSKEVTMIENLN